MSESINKGLHRRRERSIVTPFISGYSTVVVRRLAKAKVVGPNPIARSHLEELLIGTFTRLIACLGLGYSTFWVKPHHAIRWCGSEFPFKGFRSYLCGYSTTAVREISNLHMRVRFPLPAQSTYDVMIKKVTEIQETTIYVGDKLVVMRKEVQTVRFLSDKPKD